MRRIILLSISVMLTVILFAGGIVTNQNQSAMYTRLQARDATLGIDAVFYNPAGLTLLPNNGFYFSLNNQTIGQNRLINSNYDNLNNQEYKGVVSAPLFPGLYAAYKRDNWAFSLGFNPIGGGGGGTYETGLPSFEYGISDIPDYLQAAGQDITGYSMNAYFEGTSAFFGYQANVSYQINDMISIAIGGRYVSAKETYNGYLKDIMLNTSGVMTPAATVFTGIAAQASAGATLASGAATGMQPLIDGGAGGLTFEEAETNGVIDATQRATMENGLSALGINPAGLTLEQAQGAYSQASTTLTATAGQASVTSILMQDQEVEYEKTATGFTPIISVNIKASDKLNLALKYEHHTKLEFENKTTKDFTSGFDASTGEFTTKFPDGAKSRIDLPSLLVIGATYKPLDKLSLSTGFHYYFDKGAEYGRTGEDDAGNEIIYKNADILDNSWEFAFGAEYSISAKFLASLGWLRTANPVDNEYQSDLSYALGSNTIGGGFEYKISPMFNVNLAGSYTKYIEGTKIFDHTDLLTNTVVTTETYNKDNWVVAIGLNFNFSAGK